MMFFACLWGCLGDLHGDAVAELLNIVKGGASSGPNGCACEFRFEGWIA